MNELTGMSLHGTTMSFSPNEILPRNTPMISLKCQTKPQIYQIHQSNHQVNPPVKISQTSRQTKPDSVQKCPEPSQKYSETRVYARTLTQTSWGSKSLTW